MEVEFDGIRVIPLLVMVREEIDLASHEKIDAFLAVGGGSVLDFGKAICVGVPADHDSYLPQQKWDRRDLDPVYELTLSGSGTEMICGMVLPSEESDRRLASAPSICRIRGG